LKSSAFNGSLIHTTGGLGTSYRQKLVTLEKLCLQPTLFGEVMLVRNWGRVGTNGQMKFETFAAGEDAEKVLNRIERSKRRRGYVDC
jgi:predicted DNA-binding WGR domain protein